MDRAQGPDPRLELHGYNTLREKSNKNQPWEDQCGSWSQTQSPWSKASGPNAQGKGERCGAHPQVARLTGSGLRQQGPEAAGMADLLPPPFLIHSAPKFAPTCLEQAQGCVQVAGCSNIALPSRNT